MSLTKWLKKAMGIHSPSEEMKPHSDECAHYIGVIVAKFLGAIDRAVNNGKEGAE